MIYSCDAPQGTFLGRPLFTMCTTLSTLISSVALNHHLNADDINFSSQFTVVTLTQVSPTFRMLCNRFPYGNLQIFLLFKS